MKILSAPITIKNIGHIKKLIAKYDSKVD